MSKIFVSIVEMCFTDYLIVSVGKVKSNSITPEDTGDVSLHTHKIGHIINIIFLTKNVFYLLK